MMTIPKVFSLPLFSISAEILKERKAYYDTLDIISSQLNMDITVWLNWWCVLVEKAIDRSLENASGIVMRARFWTACKHFSLNDRQNKVLEKMANVLPDDFEGGMSSKKYKSIYISIEPKNKKQYLAAIDKIIEFYGKSGEIISSPDRLLQI